MSSIEHEALNVVPPLVNSAAMKSQAALPVSSTVQHQYIPSLFGRLGSGHYLTVAADMSSSTAKLWFAVGPNSTGALDPRATATRNIPGSDEGLCWPLPDGQHLDFRIPGGTQQATGVSTGCQYDWLHWCGNATGVLRLFRSSLAPAQGTDQFGAPL
jgi:hypothetical protein